MNSSYSRRFIEFKDEVKQAIEEEDDVLAAYTRFVDWLVESEQDHGQASKAGSSGGDEDLIVVLEEAVRRLKGDPLCLSDRRYLKLWIMFAQRVSNPKHVYEYMFANKIGTLFYPLYEEYANTLEMDSRLKEADAVYQQGISSRVRGVDKLKRCYADYKQRVSSNKLRRRSSKGNAGTAKLNSIYHDPFQNFPDAKRKPSASSNTTNPASSFVPSSDPYFYMTQPAPSGSKRPERLRFDLSLLFKDGKEHCIEEARARSMGLLGKKWGPPPLTEQDQHQPIASTERTSDKGTSGNPKNHTSTSSGRMMMTMNITAALNKVGGGAEPTVTINTKEALRDVFGMYNSPERATKTTRVNAGKANAPLEGTMLPPPPPIGSKHAPVRKVEPTTPAQALSRKSSDRDVFSDENASAKPIFKPFVDADKKENSTPAPLKMSTQFKPFVDGEGGTTPAPAAKFKPFVDSDASNANSETTPGPRRALSLKEISTPSVGGGAVLDEKRTASAKALSSSTGGVFSGVFTPAGKFDRPSQTASKSSIGVFQDKTESAQPAAKPPGNGARTTLTIHRDDDAPKQNVFSRPGADGSLHRPPSFKPVSGLSCASSPGENTAPAPVFRKVDLSASSFGAPQRGVFAPAPSLQSDSGPVFSAQGSWSSKLDTEEHIGGVDNVDDSFDDEGEEVVNSQDGGDAELMEDDYDESQYEYGVDSYRMGGGRCGAYDVMTPIAERTCEFTMNTRGFSAQGTPNDRGNIFGNSSRQSGVDAVEAAERLAKELKEDEERHARGSVFRPQPKIAEDEDEEESESDGEADDIAERTGTLSLADAIAVASSFKPPNPCVPSDPLIINTLLSLFPQEPEFHDHRGEAAQMLDGIQKFIGKSARRGSSKSNSSRSSDEGSYEIELKGRPFEIREKLGEGGFGAVYMAKDVNGEEDEDEDEYANVYALKIVRPRNIWEYHILRSIHNTLPASIRASIIQPRTLYAFKDESFLVLDLCRQGTLLDVVNRANQAGVMQQGACLDELLVMFFSIELLRFVIAMHSAGFIHGDFKIDNCLLRLEEVPGVASAWSGLYHPSGDGGWRYKGIKMIDFGRTINTRLFPAGQQFVADWKVDARDCKEMNQNKPWTFQTDYYGLAGVIYCMLYGKYFEESTVIQASSGRHKLSTPFKRYWQVDLWTRLFDALLNSTLLRADGSLPICEELGEIRTEMEEWLQNNCNRSSISLKSLLKKVELSFLEL